MSSNQYISATTLHQHQLKCGKYMYVNIIQKKITADFLIGQEYNWSLARLRSHAKSETFSGAHIRQIPLNSTQRSERSGIRRSSLRCAVGIIG